MEPESVADPNHIPTIDMEAQSPSTATADASGGGPPNIKLEHKKAKSERAPWTGQPRVLDLSQ